MVTIATLLKSSGQRLQTVSDTPRLDAEVLLGHVLNTHRSYLYTWPERYVSSEHQRELEALLLRREQGEPIAHLTGQKEFWSLNLKVTPATLVPRPETELLVEQALKTVKLTEALVLDLGTGTGAIALALAKERPNWSIFAVDYVPEAVALAQENARVNKLTNIQVMESNWFGQIEQQGLGPFNVIVSNPPYIDANDGHLAEGDVRYEPASALVSDNFGMADIERIVKQSTGHLTPRGWLLLEHGYRQGLKVRELLVNNGYTLIQTIQDLAGQERVTLACRE